MLDSSLKEQLQTIFKELSAHYTFDATVAPEHAQYNVLKELLGDLCECVPDKFSYTITEGKGLKFVILKDGINTGITFRSTPNGQEFSSLILAILNCDGKGKNFPTETLIERIKNIKGPIQLTTYISLSCPACADIVQQLNAITSIGNHITHEIVDGAINKMEIIEKHIMGLPTVYANRTALLVGRATYADIVDKLEAKYGTY